MKNKIKNMVKVLCMLFVLVMAFTACDFDGGIESETTVPNEYVMESETTLAVGNETQSNINENKVDVNELISDVQFLNYNGYGYMKVNVWACSLSERIDKEKMKNFVASVAPTLAAVRYSQEGYAYYFEDIVRFAPLEDYNRLSNGDVVTVVAKITDEFAPYGVTVAQVKQYFNIDFDETVTYTVSGLLEGGTPIDVMSCSKQYIYNGEVKIPENYSFNAGVFTFVRSHASENQFDVTCGDEWLGNIKYEVNVVNGKNKITLKHSNMLETMILSKGYFFSDVFVYC